MSDSKDKFILHKDIEMLQYPQPPYVHQGGIIYLTSPTCSPNIKSVAALSVEDDKIGINLTLEATNLYDFQRNEILKNSKKDLHLQGNTIAFFIKVKSQRNFYRFEFDARGNQSLYYFRRLKNQKYKPEKLKKTCVFEQYYSAADMFWNITISIPFAYIGLSQQDINGSNFLLARYIYSQSTVKPAVVDSMAIGEEQFKNPEAWNMFSFDDPDKKETNKQPAEDSLTRIVELKKLKFAKEYFEKSILEEQFAEFYTELLNLIYSECDKIEYNEMFRTLERFVNIPEFVADRKLQMLTAILIDIFLNKAYGLMNLMQLIMDGTAFLKVKEAQDEIKSKYQQRATYLQKDDKNQAQEKREAESKRLEPCFWEIWRWERQGEKFGKIGPKRYFAENCPCLKKEMKFSTLRSKYEEWFKSIPKESEEFKNPPSKPCAKNKNWCKNLPSR